MRILLVLALGAFVVAATPEFGANTFLALAERFPAYLPSQSRNLLVNLFITQLINFVRGVINNGMGSLGIPPLDPLRVDRYHLVIPAGIINLDLELENAEFAGLGGFRVHRSHLDLNELSFDIDVSVPRLDISTDLYDLNGDLFSAIPLYGKGKAQFVIENLRVKAKLYLKQSDNEQAVIIDRIENPSFELPSFKSSIHGAIGGGEIDAIVNAVVEEVLIGYVNRFHGAISSVVSDGIVTVANPFLETLDTWRFIANLLPPRPPRL